MVTCKGTWLEAAFYYAEHFPTIKDFLHSLEDDSQAIVEANRIMLNNDMLNELAVIRGPSQS